MTERKNSDSGFEKFIQDSNELEVVIIASACYNEIFKKTVLQGFKALGITKTQLEISITLFIDGPHTISELSDRLYVKLEQVSRSIRELKLLELVHTERDSHDGRNVVASLTPKGIEFMENRAQISGPILEEYVSRLSPEDQGILIECSKKVIEVFRRSGQIPS